MDGFQKRTQVKKDRIIEQAKHLFSERGFTLTNVQDIAHYANVSPVSIYNYFEHKEGVLAVIFKQELDMILEDIVSLDGLIHVLSRVLNVFDTFHEDVQKTLIKDKHQCFQPVIDAFFKDQLVPYVNDHLKYCDSNITLRTMQMVLAEVKSLIFANASTRRVEEKSLMTLLKRGIHFGTV